MENSHLQIDKIIFYFRY